MSEAPTTSQSPAQSPPALMWGGVLPAAAPIRAFTPPRPASATSATASERKRRTRRSSASSSSMLDELDAADLLGLDGTAHAARAGPRPASAQGRVDAGARPGLSCSPQANRTPVRSKTALGHRYFFDEAQSPQLSSASVHFSGAAEGPPRDAVRRGRPRAGSPSRPKSASGLPSYLQPSQSYLRSLTEPRPTTPGDPPRSSRGPPVLLLPDCRDDPGPVDVSVPRSP
jgi:hypothetical protein